MNFAAAIEKNRMKLLRMIACWLMLAAMVKCAKDRTLPPRLARLVSNLLSKVDAASKLLVIATARVEAGGLEPARASHHRMGLIYPVPPQLDMTIDDIRSRLIMMWERLRNLDGHAKRVIARWRTRNSAISFFERLRLPQAICGVIRIRAFSDLAQSSVRCVEPP